jgi:3-hydroxyisobutyrate dehydrogenase-like beta-hydroxyacid dehydrogenase
MDPRATTIGLIGLGKMGSGIAANLLRSGFRLLCHDKSPAALTAATAAGAEAAADVAQVLDRCGIVATCVEGRDSMRIADETLIPGCRPGQVFIDHSTVPVPAARRIGAAFKERGADYLDAPISGGREGAARGTLRIFVGGDQAVARACWPLFEAIGDPAKLVYCGPTGAGQIAKVVQQMTVRLPDMARLEVIAFGLRSGLGIDLVMRALDVAPDSADRYALLCRAIETGQVEKLSFEFAEWEYYFEQARAAGFAMPMLEGLYHACKDGELVTEDGAGRREPSVWNQMTRRADERGR